MLEEEAELRIAMLIVVDGLCGEMLACDEKERLEGALVSSPDITKGAVVLILEICRGGGLQI
jgi:hypothetical protein